MEPQFNLDAERQLLGSSFRDREVAVHLSKVLTVDHFHSDRHQHVFRSIQSIIMSDGEIDPVTVAAELDAMGVLLNVGGAPAVIDIFQSTITAAAWKQKLGIVQEKYAQRRMAGIANNIYLDAESLSGPFEEIAQAYIDQINDLKREVSGTRAIDTFDVLSAKDFDGADLNIEWIIPGIMAKGMHFCFGGPEKSAKTLFACELAISITTGTPFMGQFQPTEKLNTLVMSCETTGGVLRDNIRALCRSRSKEDGTTWKLSEIEGLFMSFTTPNMSKHEELERLRRTIVANNIKIVIIDPVYLSMGADLDAANLFAVGSILRGVVLLAQELGVTLVFCHHANKKLEMGEFCQLRHLSFAGWRENLASWFLVNLFADFDPDKREHSLLVNLGSRAGNSGKYRITINEGEFDNPSRKVKFFVRTAESKQNHDQKEHKKREGKIGLIVEALTKYPDGATARTLRAATNITSGALMADLLEVLVVRGLATQVEVKATKGPSSTGYKLTGSKWVHPGSDPVEPTKSGLLGYRVSPLIGETQTQNPVGGWEVPSKAEGF